MVTPLESGPVKVHHTPFARCALSLLVSGPVETHRTPFCPLSLFSTSKWPSRDAPHILCSLLSSKWSSKNAPHPLPVAHALSVCTGKWTSKDATHVHEMPHCLAHNVRPSDGRHREANCVSLWHLPSNRISKISIIPY